MPHEKNYFAALVEKASKLDELANKYLENFKPMSNEEAVNRIHKAAQELLKEAGENFDQLPDWAAESLDGHVPYSTIPKNRSLGFTLGFSIASQEAHLRNLLEIAEGRTTQHLSFPVVAKL